MVNGLLERLKALRTNIRIGIAGIGSVGKGMVLQAQITPGIECVAVADIVLERAVAWVEWLKMDYRVVRNLGDMHDTIRRGKLAVCEDGNLVGRCELIDVFMESTNSVSAGGQLGITALEHHKHLIMMNYEADLMFGPYLMRLAQARDRVYTSCDGDQPAVLKRLIDEVEFMGFRLVMAGNIKGYLDLYATPTSIIPEADKRGLDYRMCASFTDGTKLNVEMAVLANALGLRTAIPGMHGPQMQHVKEVFDHFDFHALWRDQQPVVDYVLGARPKGGVFVVGFTDNQHQQDTLAWFPSEMGPGPFYLFYRPYHLSHFESMASVAAAALDGRSILKPDFGFKTNVYAYAKRDLERGEVLDGLGGYTCYGKVENRADNHSRPGLPICLSDGVTLCRNVRKDEKIFTADVVYDENRFDFELFAKAVEAAGETGR